MAKPPVLPSGENVVFDFVTWPIALCLVLAEQFMSGAAHGADEGRAVLKTKPTKPLELRSSV